MNYASHDIKERLRMAREYALMISSEIKTPFTIISKTQKQFSLTKEEAVQVYHECRQLYPQEWRSNRKRNIWKMILGLLFCLILGIFYLFVGKEIFILWALGALMLIMSFGVVRLLYQQFSQEWQLKQQAKKTGKH